MEQPTITADSIAAYHALHREFKTLSEQASEAIKNAKLNGENEITIARDAQPVVVREKDLWDEVWNLGGGCDAGKILSEKYPEAFDLSRKTEEKKQELKKYALAEWNIDPLAMSLSDIIRIIEGVVDYKLASRAV